MDGDGGGLIRGGARPDQADGIAGAEKVQQRLEQGVFIVAGEVVNGFGLGGQRSRAGGGREVVIVQGFEVVDHAGAGGDLRVVRSGGGEFLGAVAGVEIVRLRGQGVGQSAADDHDPLVRAKGLVRREQIDVRAQLAHVG